MKLPRILICAGASGSGKTLITCGILQTLVNRGLKPASFKCGPDYIDPMFHTRVIGTRSRNLDTFFAGKETLQYLLCENSREADLAVIEGVMGYYDGIGMTASASSYDVSRVTETPAVLVLNCRGMSLSAAAFLKGFSEFRQDSRIRGVILNQCSPMVYSMLREEIEKNTEIKVIGYVPKVEDCRLESRHLGLVMPDEIRDLKEKLMKLASILENTLDLDTLLQLAETAPELMPTAPQLPYHTRRPVRVAIARDEAFCFLYEDNLSLLKQMGAQLVPFSPVHEGRLPEEIDGLLLPGGYPELFAKSLASNGSMLSDLRCRCLAGLPLLAECGGFMYLHESMEDTEGNSWPVAGVLPGKAYKTDRLGRFGYIRVTDDGKGKTDGKQEGFFDCLGRDPGSLPAHEFHYFDTTDPGSSFLAEKPSGNRSWRCIRSSRTMLAGFPHFYYYGNPALPEAFLRKCEAFRDAREKGEETC